MYSPADRTPDFLDCDLHGEGSELLLVEGDSALSAVRRVRFDDWQAVFSVQGKIPNALRVTERKIRTHIACDLLFSHLGTAMGKLCNLADARYERVVICTDADEDGMHAQALLTMLFLHWLKPWVAAGRLFVARPPLFRLTTEDEQHFYAYTPAQRDEMVRRIEAAGHQTMATTRFKGLAQMEPDEVRRMCLDPATRRLIPIDIAAAERAAATFARFLVP
jgi:DNA gyrase/topoisomerase IV subunit B